MEPLQEDITPPPGPDILLSAVAPQVRVIADEDGRIWTVEQLRAAAADPAQRPSLLFTTDNLMRRIRRFPENWHELSDAELYALSMKP